MSTPEFGVSEKKEKRPCLCSVYGCISAGHCHSAERRTWLGCKGGSQGDGRHHRATGTKTDSPQSHWYVISNGCRKLIKSMSMVGSLNLGQLTCFELSFQVPSPSHPMHAQTLNLWRVFFWLSPPSCHLLNSWMPWLRGKKCGQSLLLGLKL